jgi:hypothetical protein
MLRKLEYRNGRFAYGLLFLGAAYENHNAYKKALIWCTQEFGDHGRQTDWYESTGCFWFVNPNDAFAFKMRFG